MARCQDCGEHSPDQASFCIVCGARLIAPATRMRVPIPPAIGPTIRLNPADNAPPTIPTASNAPPTIPTASEDRAPDPPAQCGFRQALVPVVGLVFGTAVVLGIAQLFALNGLHVARSWPVMVLLGGVLLAESAWVNGQLWRGLRGMLLWGGLIGLMAFGQVMPWALALALGWLALHPALYGRHT